MVIFDTCNHLRNLIVAIVKTMNVSITLKVSLCSFVIYSPLTHNPILENHGSALSHCIFKFHCLKFYINGVIQYGLFCLASFNWDNYFEIHPHCYMYQSFIPFFTEKYSIIKTCHNLFIHSLWMGIWVFPIFDYYT